MTTETRAVMYRCKRGHAFRANVPIVWIEDVPGARSLRFVNAIGLPQSSPPHRKCPHCDKDGFTTFMLSGKLINGRFSAKRKCDARCLNAKGPNCECQCGGANHGSNWGGGL